MANVTVLSTANWAEWLSQAEKILGANECSHLMKSRYIDVTGEELSAEEQVIEADIAKREADTKDPDEKKKLADEREEKGVKLDAMTDKEKTAQYKCMFAIEQTVAAEDRRYLAKCKTVRQQIELLRKHKVKPQHVYALTEELTKLNWKKEETAMQFLHRLNDLKARLETARGGQSEDPAFVTKLVAEIPNTMNFTRLSIENEIHEGKTIDYRLLCERVQRAHLKAVADEEKRKTSGEKTNADKSGREYGRGDHSGRPRASYYTERKCFNCGSPNHLARECPERKKSGGFTSRYDEAVSRVDQSDRNDQVCGQGGQPNDQIQNQSRENGGQTDSQGNQNRSNTNQYGQNSNRSAYAGAGGNQSSPQSSLANIIQRARSQINDTYAGVTFATRWPGEDDRRDYAQGSRTKLADDQFMHDNGSSTHIVNDRDAFVTYTPLTDPNLRRLESVNGGEAEGVGAVRVVSVIKGGLFPFVLGDVLYCPNSPVNIFSERAARSKGMSFKMTADKKYDYLAGYAPDGGHLTNARSSISRPEGFAMSLFLRKSPSDTPREDQTNLIERTLLNQTARLPEKGQLDGGFDSRPNTNESSLLDERKLDRTARLPEKGQLDGQIGLKSIESKASAPKSGGESKQFVLSSEKNRVLPIALDEPENEQRNTQQKQINSSLMEKVSDDQSESDSRGQCDLGSPNESRKGRARADDERHRQATSDADRQGKTVKSSGEDERQQDAKEERQESEPNSSQSSLIDRPASQQAANVRFARCDLQVDGSGELPVRECSEQLQTEKRSENGQQLMPMPVGVQRLRDNADLRKRLWEQAAHATKMKDSEKSLSESDQLRDADRPVDGGEPPDLHSGSAEEQPTCEIDWQSIWSAAAEGCLDNRTGVGQWPEVQRSP